MDGAQRGTRVQPVGGKKTASERRLFSLLSVLRGLEARKMNFQKNSDFFKFEFFSEF